MYLKTDLEGKIHNLRDFKNEALLPVFEAISNSIQAIEERNNNGNRGEIIVKILRDPDSLSDFVGDLEEKKEERKIKSFEIEDNGIGFNQANFNSFLTSDSTYKIDMGGKGVGRFSWLKAFEKAEIESVYIDNDGNKKVRRFDFAKDGVEEYNDGIDAKDLPQKTTVKLINFNEDYRKLPSAYKTTSKIAQRILENCLSYFINKTAPSISIVDGETITLDKLYEDIIPNIKEEKIKISGHQFNICHVRLHSTYSNMHNIVLCANNRDVESYPIQKDLGTSYQLDDNGKKFYYAAYITSDYLDAHVNSTRTSFDLPDIDNLQSFTDDDISKERIKKAILKRTKEFLSDYLVSVDKIKHEKINDFVSSNPSLRAVPTYCPEVFNEIEVNSSDDVINEVLYKYKGKTELNIQKEYNKLLKTHANNLIEIKDEVNKLTSKIEVFNKDQLAGYVLYRKKIIDLLAKKLEVDNNGTYEQEKVIHDIIFPRKATSDEIDIENLNLWIIDEILTFHQLAVSDQELNKHTSLESDRRPDIFICDEKDDDGVARAVSIVEFKRPKRDNLDKDPVTQMYEIIDDIKGKKILTNKGRDIIVNDSTRFYCYAICDINEEIIRYAKFGNFQELKDGLGYYNYNSQLKCNTLILAFDKIIGDVKKRHQIFFEKLGIKN
jgi:hypothetical protein